jgi:predicted anti-sigma-YlaC factor YlaD
MTACERAQQWLSLELDGELSELERVALTRHLEWCASCREAAARMAGLTSLLRAEPLLEPTARAAVAARPGRTRRAKQAAALALAAVVGTVVGGLVLPVSGGPSKSALSFSDRAQQVRFVRAQRLREPVLYRPAARVPPQTLARAL